MYFSLIGATVNQWETEQGKWSWKSDQMYFDINLSLTNIYMISLLCHDSLSIIDDAKSAQ